MKKLSQVRLLTNVALCLLRCTAVLSFDQDCCTPLFRLKFQHIALFRPSKIESHLGSYFLNAISFYKTNLERDRTYNGTSSHLSVFFLR